MTESLEQTWASNYKLEQKSSLEQMQVQKSYFYIEWYLLINCTISVNPSVEYAVPWLENNNKSFFLQEMVFKSEKFLLFYYSKANSFFKWDDHNFVW